MDTVPQKPRPVPDAESAGYWEAASRHELVIARCAHCGHYALPPPSACPKCLRTDAPFEWAPVSGRGTIRSWTVIRDSFLAGFRDDVPFVLVDVELDEQADLRMIGRLVDGPMADLRIGLRVATVFDDRARGVSIPAFEVDRG